MKNKLLSKNIIKICWLNNKNMKIIIILLFMNLDWDNLMINIKIIKINSVNFVYYLYVYFLVVCLYILIYYYKIVMN